MKSSHLTWAATTAILLSTCAVAPVTAGPMQGINGHQAAGSATISGGKVMLSDDFRFDGGPDVYVTVKKGNKLFLLGKLKSNSGAQSYSLPAGDDGAGVADILLYCKQYKVVLGKAAAW